MFNRNENRMNGHMRRFEGFGMNGGPGRGPGQFGGFRQMNGKDRFFKKEIFNMSFYKCYKKNQDTGIKLLKI